MAPIWALWWFRPVSSAARVGEHNAVVWNWFVAQTGATLIPGLESGRDRQRWRAAPKPTSSSRTTTTLGAPAGGEAIVGLTGVESRRRWIDHSGELGGLERQIDHLRIFRCSACGRRRLTNMGAEPNAGSASWHGFSPWTVAISNSPAR